MMTERQAWKYLAGRFAKTKVEKNGDETVTVGGDDGLGRKDEVFGLCMALTYLRYQDRIDYDTRRSMASKIERERERLEDDDLRRGRVRSRVYIWRRDRRGNLARANFCRRMAKVVA